jgi:FkbM family methyltransferase
MRLHLASALPADFQIMLCDAGSAGGLHPRWRRFLNNVTTVFSDPLDETSGGPRDIYLPFALGAESGEKSLFVTKRIMMTSMLRPHQALLERFWDKPEHTKIVKELTVPVRALDDLLNDRDIKLDAIKVDVQGTELDILQGAKAALQSILTAEIEVSLLDRYKDQARFWDINAFMESQGFELIDISRIKRYRHANQSGLINPWQGGGKRAGRIAFCDALYVRRYDQLVERITDPVIALKVMLLLLVYGKADLAAHIFDLVQAPLEPPIRKAIARDLRAIARWHWGRLSPHHILDYLASKS